MPDFRAVVETQLATLKKKLYELDFDSMTPEGLQDFLLAFLENEAGLATNEGSFVRMLLAPGAYSFWEGLQLLRAQQSIAFPDANSGRYIDLDASRYGLKRKAGTRATLTLAFTGEASAKIPAGTLCVSADGLTFGTDALLTLDANGEGTVAATATLVGTAYNVEAGSVTSTQYAVGGVSGVSNVTAGVGGTNAETDAALYARLDALRKTPATSGNERHYKEWALEVNGVGAANVVRCWNGGGTVKVVIADMDMKPASNALCEAVRAHIEDKRPVTAEVTVQSAQGIPIAVTANVVTNGIQSLADIEETFHTRLTAYLSEVTYQSGTRIVWSKVFALLVSLPGVSDCNALQLNGLTENVDMLAGDIALLGNCEVEEVSA